MIPNTAVNRKMTLQLVNTICEPGEPDRNIAPTSEGLYAKVRRINGILIGLIVQNLVVCDDASSRMRYAFFSSQVTNQRQIRCGKKYFASFI